jgi:hypothetical protein
MAEQFLPALLSVLRGEDSHTGVESEEQVSVGLSDVPFPGFELFAESVELPVGVNYQFRIDDDSYGRL